MADMQYPEIRQPPSPTGGMRMYPPVLQGNGPNQPPSVSH